MPPRKMEPTPDTTPTQTPPAAESPAEQPTPAPKAKPVVKKGKQPAVSTSIHGNKVYNY